VKLFSIEKDEKLYMVYFENETGLFVSEVNGVTVNVTAHYEDARETVLEALNGSNTKR
jgi:hypothetical protein